MKSPRIAATALILFLLIAGTAAAETKATKVPLRFDGTYALVPVTVGARNLMFILDSAAGGSVISPATRDALGFTDKDGEIAHIVGAGGTTEYQSMRIPSITFGGFTQRDFHVTVIDLRKFQKKDGGEPYAGILGNDFLRHFDVEINLRASEMVLYPHDEKGQTTIARLKGLTAVPNTAEMDGFIAFEASVEGKPVSAILDTGAPATIVNWPTAKQAGVTPESEGVTRREQGTGGRGTQKAETFNYQFKEVAAGPTRFPAGELRIADLPIFKALGMNEKPSMILGLDLLQKRVLFVSYSTKKIYFYE
jgi:predicted aspartyl protease